MSDYGHNAQVSGSLTVTGSATFNESGADEDFRVESDGESHLIFAEGSTNRVSIGDNTGSPNATLEVKNNASAGAFGVPLVQLNNNDTDEIALDINASNIDARVVDITANAVTTANIVNINCNARTTGTGFRIYDGATNDSAGPLAQITQGGDRAGSAASKGLEINFNTTANTNARALYIDSEQTTGQVVEVDADQITTGKGVHISANALTTGNALYVDDSSSNTGTRNAALIIQNDGAAIGATALHVQSDGGVTGVKLDKNYSDTAEASIVGLNIDWDKTGASTTSNTMYGIQLDMDNTTATNGANYMYGLHVTPTLTHAADAGSSFVYGALINAQGGTNGTSLVQGARIEAGGGDINYGIQLDVEDGGVDLRIESSADSGDYFQIQTTTHGATTITTVDDDAAAADLTFTIDGDLTLDSEGKIVIEAKASDEVVFNQAGLDVDFRVETADEANMLVAEGSTNRVGIGIGAPSGTLHVSGPGTSDTKVIIESLGDSSLWIVADTDNATETQNPSLYMSQESSTDDAYQFHMGIEGNANQSFTGSYQDQPFILSRKDEAQAQSVRTFQIATDDGGEISSRFCIAHGGKIQIADSAREADCRLHVKEVAGDIFKLENTTAYGVTHGQLVATGVSMGGVGGSGASPVDTGLNLPAHSIVDTVVVKLTQVGAVSSGMNFTLSNVQLSGAAPLIAQTMYSASISNVGLISAFQAQSGTMYYLNNNQTNYPVGAVGQLAGAAQDIKLTFSSANVTTNAVVDVAVYYRKFDTIR